MDHLEVRLETRLLNGSYLRFGDNPQNPLGTRSGTEQKVSEKSDRMTDATRAAPRVPAPRGRQPAGSVE